MQDSENQHMPDVSTEPQRQALDEMSRQLVEKLNEMVREQHERAHSFAATQHSLSPLPGIAPTVPPLLEEPTPQAPPPPAPVPKPRIKKPGLFRWGSPDKPRLPQDFSAAPREESPLPTLPQKNKKVSEKTSESGCGTVPTVIAIIIILIIIRSCS